MKRYYVLLLSGSALGMFSASSAFGQTDEAPRGGIADIVVTATRQSESVQRVPIAITALSGETLTQANATSLQSIAALSPGVQIQPQFKPGDAVFQIRGQVQSDTAPTIDPSVGVYFDDVYIARSAGSLVNLLDVSRVEVLKGPQGTLFGKNTTGGAIRIISNQPTHEFEGYAKVGYESFETYRLEGVINVPLGETLAARFAGQYVDKNGSWVRNSVSGKGIDKLETLSLRGSLLWEPTDTLRISVGGDYSKITGGGLPGYLRYFIPATGGSSALEAAAESGLGFNAAAGAALMQAATSGSGTRVAGVDLRVVGSDSYTFNRATGAFTYNGGNIDPTTYVETYGALANVTLDLGNVTLKSITAYRHVDADYFYNVDGTQYHIADSNQIVKSKQFSQELLLNGSILGDSFKWTVGGIYFDEKPFSRDKSVSVAALIYPSRSTDTLASARNKSWGVFAQGTYAMTDALSLTAGARYSIDKRGFTSSAFNRNAPAGTSSCVYTVANGLALLPGFQAPCSISQDSKFKQWSYTASLNYQIDADKMVYFRTGRGYRAGGFNPRINAPEVVGQFKPEIVTDYEFGLKADWLDRTLRTNLAIFTSTGKDVQQTVNGVSPTTNGTITTTQNVGKRIVKGVEFDMIVRPTDWFSVDAGLAYLHARSRNPLERDVSYVQLTAPITWSTGVNIDMPFNDNISGKLRVDLSYRDKMHDGAPFRSGGNIIYEGYFRDIALIGARYTLTEAKSGIQLSIYGRNLTNQLYEARAFTIPALGLGLGTLAEPRVIGAELKVPFGAR